MTRYAYIIAPPATAPHAATGTSVEGVAEPLCGSKPAYPTWPQATSGAGEGAIAPLDPPPVQAELVRLSDDDVAVVFVEVVP